MTPLYDALRALADRRTARFHMPGHKGAPAFPDWGDACAVDFTEVSGTGNLYTGEGPIRLAEIEAARYYGTAECHFLTGGATQGIHALLYAAVPAGGRILLDRNCHKAAAHACAMLDLTPDFVFPETLEPFGIPGRIAPDAVARALDRNPDIRTFLVTSPNYYGVIQDIPALAAVCRMRGVTLLVDAAHGAHFPAVGRRAPTVQGAAGAVMSAHKTLNAFGQTALLLTDGALDGARLREGAALFGTSSPSYLLMASLDRARAALEAGDGYARAADAVAALRARLRECTPFLPLQNQPLDPCRLTLCTAGTHWTGDALADALYDRFGVACEMSDARNLVCIVTPADLPENLGRLDAALSALALEAEPAAWPDPLPSLPAPKRVCTVRQAVLSPCRAAAPDQAAGMVCARPVTPYPPGVPVLWPGEEITPAHIVFLARQCYNTIGSIHIIEGTIPQTKEGFPL